MGFNCLFTVKKITIYFQGGLVGVHIYVLKAPLNEKDLKFRATWGKQFEKGARKEKRNRKERSKKQRGK